MKSKDPLNLLIGCFVFALGVLILQMLVSNLHDDPGGFLLAHIGAMLGGSFDGIKQLNHNLDLEREYRLVPVCGTVWSKRYASVSEVIQDDANSSDSDPIEL
jgi:hypothetical protein